jgi:hypothetical protein
MPKNTQMTNARVNVQADGLATTLNNGYLRVYSGTQPATADTALSGNTLLAESRFNVTAAPAAVAGLLTFNSFTNGNAVASGTATFYRCLQSDGTTVVMDGNVGTTDQNMVVPTTTITSGVPFNVTSFTHQVLKSSSGL